VIYIHRTASGIPPDPVPLRVYADVLLYQTFKNPFLLTTAVWIRDQKVAGSNPLIQTIKKSAISKDFGLFILLSYWNAENPNFP
jgi:hypothetical protein